MYVEGGGRRAAGWSGGVSGNIMGVGPCPRVCGVTPTRQSLTESNDPQWSDGIIIHPHALYTSAVSVAYGGIQDAVHVRS